MKIAVSLVLCAAVGAASIAAASPLEKQAKEDLVTLYLMSIAADRCAFAMTAKQADMLEHASRTLAENLKLRGRENDALYSEADIRFEQVGPSACDRSGDFAKGFRQTLQQITGQ